MTADAEPEGTESGIPVGEYQKAQESPGREERTKSTDKAADRSAPAHKVQLSEKSLESIRVVRVRIDVEADKRKAEIAALNDRLAKLRNRR
jgi:hypothetical protein